MSDSKGGAGGMGGMNMVTTVMAFSVSAFFVLFVFTRLLCARLHLSRAAAAADRAAGDAFVVSAYNVRRPPALRPLPLPISRDFAPLSAVLSSSMIGDSCRESTLRARAGGARDPRAGALRGDDLPHRQARRRRPAAAAGAGGAVKISPSSSSSLFFAANLLSSDPCVHHAQPHMFSLHLATFDDQLAIKYSCISPQLAGNLGVLNLLPFVDRGSRESINPFCSPQTTNVET
jgi:hypothetical protein